MDKLQAIRFFVKLADTLSFKRTAQYFRVPPSTVSRSIKALEGELGAQLVERTTRQVRLTELGEWYRSEVVAPLRALTAADELVGVRSREAQGTLRITALPGYGESRLFAVLNRFRVAHPRIVCDVEFTDRYLDLSAGDIDVALRATADPPEYLVARHLHKHRFVLVAAPDYLARNGRPTTVSAVQEHAAIVYRGPAGVAPWLAMLPNGDTIVVPRNPVLLTNHARLLMQAALAGEGLAFLPEWGVADALQDGSLEEITLKDARLVVTRGPQMSLYLLYHPRKARLGKVRAAVDFLTAALSHSPSPDGDGRPSPVGSE
ncbi:MAG: LysR family transcriptional regulator [Myxococcota bacterium]